MNASLAVPASVPAPAQHPLWRAVFGDDRPVEIEIGPGFGDVLLAFARAHPDRGFIGIERCSGATAEVVERLADAGIANVRALSGDAQWVISHWVPADSVSAYHIYFPDPWPKRRHHRRRMLHGNFGAELLRTLQPGGLLYLATDVGELLTIMDRATARSGFERADDVAPRARPRTHFERKYGALGTFHSIWRRPRR